MKLELKREHKLKINLSFSDYTIGKLYINGEYFCDTLEDTDRGLDSNMPLTEIQKIKQPGITAIPTGTYTVNMNTISPKYGNKEPYKTLCGGKVPRLMNVPGYEGILIHIGNYARDTDGCILVGNNITSGMISNSKVTFEKLYEVLKKVSASEPITIQIS